MHSAKLIFLFFYAICQIQVFSQKFDGFVATGMNASQVDGDTYSGYNKPGFFLMAGTQLNISEKNSFSLAIGYSGKGSRKNQNLNTGDYSTFRIRLNYVEIPFFYIRNFGSKISGRVGVSAGYLFKAAILDDSGIIDPGLYNLNDFEFAAQTGLNYKILPKISVTLGYSYSVIPVTKVRITRAWYNNLLSVGFVYKL